MPYHPLHHKYRPQTFAQLVGQAAIAATLTNAIASRRIAPAYLFTGPRGTGKTSSARILAKSLNCQRSEAPTAEPCGQCESCRAIANGSSLDVIEIDAASNTGVDNIRDLIERAQFAPVSSRYKVYVIDECHMLSTAAFNALLKTIEEPPPRVVFVLATTDPQRVLPTIISRCQRFDYRRIPLAAMVAHLRAIAQQESINIDPTALTLVAQIANGGLRDAESLLDQLSLLPPPITPEAVWDLVGAVPERDLLALLQALRNGSPEAVLDRCRHLLDRGREPLAVLQSLANFYLHLLIAKTAPQRGDLIAVTQATWTALCQEAAAWSVPEILRGQQQLKASEGQLRQTTQPRLWLEVALLALLPAAREGIQEPTGAIAARPVTPVTTSDPTTAAPLPTPVAASSKPSPAVDVTPSLSPPEPEPPVQPEPATVPEPSIPAELEPEHLLALWQQVLDQVQPNSAKALISQHCLLLSVEPAAAIAIVGVKKPAMLKIVKSREENIQTAFDQVLTPPVKVELQVAAAGAKAANAPTSSPYDPRPRHATPSVREAEPLAPPPLPDPPDLDPEPAPSSQNGDRADASVNPSVPSAVIATEPAPAATPPTLEPSGAAPAIAPEPPPLALSDIEAAAQKFATTFKGEVIELDLDLNVGTRPSQPIVALPIPEPDVAIASEDDEIPF
ncbi:MAG: DNA polymerase III subunit gamma/tau [Spirulinaceae cyanobacterium SM2_1_0]|nr:DNA polymerase III subunit gamma/tau [Spirulinaceae cyanobacterium SM2_1_0]